MPAAIPEEIKSKVKAAAIQIGVREAARQYNVSENTVLAWARREGWTLQVQEAMEVKSKVLEERGLQSAALKEPVDVLAGYGKETKLGFAKGIATAAKKVGGMVAKDVLENAGRVKDLVASAAKVHGWESTQSQGATINIAFLSGE